MASNRTLLSSCIYFVTLILKGGTLIRASSTDGFELERAIRTCILSSDLSQRSPQPCSTPSVPKEGPSLSRKLGARGSSMHAGVVSAHHEIRRNHRWRSPGDRADSHAEWGHRGGCRGQKIY